MFMSYPEVIHMTLSKSVLCIFNYFHMFLFEALKSLKRNIKYYIFSSLYEVWRVISPLGLLEICPNKFYFNQ